MNKIEKARNEINEIDKKMAELFVKRMESVKSVAEYKKENGLQIFDKKREDDIIEKNSKLVEDKILKEYYVSFLKNNMEISKTYQHRILEGMEVAFSGVEGAFAEIALKKIFPNSGRKTYPDFKSAYKAVENGECDACVLPIENSFAGEVGQVVDLIFDGSLYLNGVYSLKIVQNLLGIHGANKDEVKEVISHPQALSQCAEYLKKMDCKLTNSVNTAVAAKTVMEKGDKTVAAIASKETAEIYGLTLLDHDINESSGNTTKFVVLSRSQNIADDADTIVLLFSVKQVAGALAKAINVMAKYGYNMKTLRSRPMKKPAWQYYFYVEAEYDSRKTNENEMINELKKECERLKVVGHYKEIVDLDR